MAFFMTINGKRVEANEGEMVLTVARRAGIDIPTLCHHEAVEPFGSCRLCMIEVTKPAWNGWKGLMTSCLYPAAADLIVETDSERVHQVRRNVLDLLLARCPDAEVIQKLAADYGVQQSTFPTRENPDKCILCGLCVRVCGQIVGAHALGGAGRGARKRVGPAFEEDDARECIGCGACAWICPSRCIEMEPIAVRRLRSRWGGQRVCRYALLRLTPGALCTRDYACASCPVDHEMFDRAGGRHPAFLLCEGRDGP